MKKVVFLLVAMLLLLSVGFVANAQGNTSYIIVANGNRLPSNLAAQVASSGGSLDVVYSEIGIAVATSTNPNFADALSGVRDVIADFGFDVESPAMEVAFVSEAGFPPNSGDDDFFFDLQWGHNAVGAQEAWAAGYTGAGVRVAVLDTGFDLDHPDLAPNINVALSTDFTGEGLQYGLGDTFSHGTHTAGTIGAADNGFGTIGVAPEVDLVLVKVLTDTGSGSFADIIAGIYYAAMVDADIISMSLGTIIPRDSSGASGNSPGDSADISALANATQRAVTFAYQSGTTVIVSAGNTASDLDGDGSAVRFLTGMNNTLGISALAPIGWATDPDNIDLNTPAFYTNYGTSMVDFGAPGGSWVYPGNELCTVAGLTRPCWVFDLVFSTGNNGWYWSGGTSMAAPHAAGVAALIIDENGGDMHPAQVAAAMRSRAVEDGAPGVDDFYGHGVANTGH